MSPTNPQFSILNPQSKAATFVAALLLLLTSPALAELAPETYRAMQRASPELVQIEVVSVDIDRDFHKPDGCRFFEFEIERKVTLEAKVRAVTRSRTGLKPGATITIQYTSMKRCEDFAGPGPIPLLHEGDRVYAYLVKKDRAFETAAMAASFTTERQ